MRLYSTTRPASVASILGLVIAVLLLLCGRATAKPMHSGPETILKTTRAVITGTAVASEGDGYSIAVHRVVWDPDGLFKGKRAIRYGYKGLDAGFDVAAGTQAAFFFDADSGLVYVAEPGRPTPLDRLETVPLHLRGFYAYNAHLTTPAVASLAGIERALRTGKFNETFAVQLTFDGRAGSGWRFTGTLIDGVPQNIAGPVPVSGARLTGWDHDFELSLTGKTTTRAHGFLTAVVDGVLTGALVPDEPYIVSAAALTQWIKTGTMAQILLVQRADAAASLTITGHALGQLGPGLLGRGSALNGALVGFVRRDKMGHRSQSSSGAQGDAAGPGWHVEIKTAKGPFWMTIPLSEVDDQVPAHLQKILSLQACVMMALKAKRVLPIRFSGVVSGEGQLRMP